MGYEIILEFLAHSGDSLSCRELTNMLGRLLNAVGFPYFAILRKVRPDAEMADYLLASHTPEKWLQIYDERHYALIDPVVRYLRKSQAAFRWRHALGAFEGDPYYPKMQRMMEEAENVGLPDGYVFPVHCDRGLIGYLTVGGPPKDLSLLEQVLLDAVAKKAFWMLLRVCAPDAAAELTRPVNIQLTRRETEALGYLADGLTSNEISQVLNISSNTVDWYMNGIQAKLKAKNRHHAVAIAFRLGLIT